MKEAELTTLREHALRALDSLPAGVAALQSFHARHKLLLMAASPEHYSALGKLAAEGKTEEYAAAFREAMQIPPTPGRLRNALDHALGYFKPHPNEHAKVSGVIDAFSKGEIPFAVAAGVVHEAASAAGIPYLVTQELFFTKGGTG